MQYITYSRQCSSKLCSRSLWVNLGMWCSLSMLTRRNLLRNSLRFNLAELLALSFSVSVLCYFGQYRSRAFTSGFVPCTISANCKEMRPWLLQESDWISKIRFFILVHDLVECTINNSVLSQSWYMSEWCIEDYSSSWWFDLTCVMWLYLWDAERISEVQQHD